MKQVALFRTKNQTYTMPKKEAQQPKTVRENRVTIAPMVAPETKQQLKDKAAIEGTSQGKIIDNAVQSYEPKPAKKST